MIRPIFTVGHSNHTWADFLTRLRTHGVEILVDVRRYPGSRRFPWFGRAELERALPEVGLGYEWLGRELGGRRSSPLAPGESPHTGLSEGWRRDYADGMEAAPFVKGLAKLSGLAGEHAVALMCAESDFRSCHRQLLSDRLVAQGLEVLHIGGDGELTPHRLPPEAELREGRLLYLNRQPRQVGLFDDDGSAESPNG